MLSLAHLRSAGIGLSVILAFGSRSAAYQAQIVPLEQAGIGAALRVEDGKVYISKILPNTPAAAIGSLHENDQLLAVAEKNAVPIEVTGLKLGAVIGHIRGSVGTVVRLTIVPAGKQPEDAVVVSLVRSKIAAIDKFVDGRLIPPGEQAPDFKFTPLLDDMKASKATSLGDLSGRIVVVEFWATWCGPCIKAIDRLQTVAARHPEWQGQVELLVVSVDDDRATAEDLSREKNWSAVRCVWVGPELLKTYRVGGIPAVFVIGRDGKVVAAGSEQPIEELLAPLLEGASK
jgi:thiol-disulfide isomerase/thioredoxin